MIWKISFLSQKPGMSWAERMACVYLLLFFFAALIGPLSGWLYSPNSIDLNEIYQPPFIFNAGSAKSPVHWLGTDQIGRDVLANLVYGARTALLVSFPAMLLTTVVGLFLGSIAGFWGNSGFRIAFVSVGISIIVLALGFYYAIYIRQLAWTNAFQKGSINVLLETGKSSFIFLLLGTGGWLVTKLLQWAGLTKSMLLPLDQLVLKLIEIIGAVPRILLILCLAAFAQPALLNIILLAALTYWTSIARLVRGEMLRVRELPYIEAGRVAGLAERRILFRHALPNALPPVVVAFAFGLGNLMSLEATLSFLGIGMPAEVPSWGRLISGIRSNFAAWWLLVFPTLALCATVLSLQVLAQFCLKLLYPFRN